jgi:anti-anti-sigma regulatory factor
VLRDNSAVRSAIARHRTENKEINFWQLSCNRTEMKFLEPLERFVEALAILWLLDLVFKAPPHVRSQRNNSAKRRGLGGGMLSIDIDNIGDLAIIECKGRIVRSQDAFNLRDAVSSQTDVRTIVLDLTEVHAVEGGGLGLLMALEKWAQDHQIQLKLFNPTYAVKSRLDSYDLAHFDVATFDEMMSLFARAKEQHTERAEAA